MQSTSFRLSMILAAAISMPAWADDVKEVPPTAAVVADANDPKIQPPGPTYDRQFETIIKECKVDPSHQDRLRDLLRTWDADTYAIVSDAKMNDPTLKEKLDSLDKEMAEATAKGNSDLIRDLTEKRNTLVEAINGWNDDNKARLADLDQKYNMTIRDLVAPENQDRLDDILASVQDAQQNRPRRGPVRSPRALKAIVDRLGDITPDQRTRIDAAFLKFRNADRAAGNKPQNKEANTTKLYDDVFAVLTVGQKSRVEQELRGREARAGQGDSKTPATPQSTGTPAADATKKPEAGSPAPTLDAGKKP